MPKITIASLRERAQVEAAELVRFCAEPMVRGEPVKARIARAAIKLGWSYSRTEGIWRKEAKRIESWEMDHLRNCRAR